MAIDWFTVIAQIVNFLVLVWLLKHFFYKPVLTAIDAREKRIADDIASAAATQKEARAEHALFEEKNATFDAERADRLRAAEEEAAAERRRLIDRAHADVTALQTQSMALLTKKATSMAETITHRAQHEAFALAQRTLRDVASSSLEAQIVDVFVIKLRGLDPEAQQTMSQALAKDDNQAVIRSAFPLPVAQQRIVQSALDDVMSTTATLTWETTDELMGGIELVVGGHTVSWTLAGHLAALEAGLATVWSEASPSVIPASNQTTARTGTKVPAATAESST